MGSCCLYGDLKALSKLSTLQAETRPAERQL